MSKTKSRKDTTIEEMEELMSQPDADEGQFAAYLQRKLAQKQRPMNNDLLFGNVSFDFDFDVKLTKKQEPAVTSENNPNAVASGETNEPTAQPPAVQNNRPTPLPAATNSPNSSPNRIRSRNVPGSDKLRRRAIRRLSQSCGRQLIKEFEEINVTRSSSSPGTFKPTVSSTPCAGQQSKDIQEKEIEENLQMKKSQEPEAEKPAEKSLVQIDPKKCLTALDSRTVDMAAEASLLYRERLSSFQNNILQLDCTGQAPSSNGGGCTYTIEKGPAPGQLLLSPSRRSSSCTAAQKRLMPVVKVKRHREELLVPDTPPRTHTKEAVPEQEFVVPDTQFQDLGELVQNLSRNASGPIVVINTANSKSVVDLAHAQPVSMVASAPPALTPLHRASTEVHSASLQPAAASYNFSPAVVSASPAKPQESPKSSRKSTLVVNNLDAIMTDDDSDEQPSTVAMNLVAQRGDDRRQQRCLRNLNNRPPTPDPDKENFVHLLNLHQSIKAKKLKQKAKPATVPLNKAPCAPINGEQFAQELARMSNYEILDLRKRNSLGKASLINGHKKSSTMQQLDLERSIQLELIRRNLKINGDRLTSTTTAVDELPESTDICPPPGTSSDRYKNQSPEKVDKSEANAVLPQPPQLNFKSTTKYTEPSRSSRRQHSQMSQEWSDDCGVLPPLVPCNFDDSRKRLQRPRRSKRCYSRDLSDESSDENEAPPVPRNFQDSRKQTKHSLPTNRRSRRMSEKTKDDTSCIPPPAPSAFKNRRSSRSRLRSSQGSSDENEQPPVPSDFQDSRKLTKHSLPSNRMDRQISEKPEDDPSFIPPPAPNAFKDRRSSRSRLQRSQESKELTNYLMISKTMEMRRSSKRSTKRKLYTKGDSNAEVSDFESPKKQKRYSRSYIHSEVHNEGDSIAIVPPPPSSLRYSQSLRDLRQMNDIDSENAPIDNEISTIEIAPPPPESFGLIRVNASLREESNEDEIFPPQTESDGTVEHALPPPTEYNEPKLVENETVQSRAPVNGSRLPSPKGIIANASKTSQEPGLQCVSSSQDKSISRLDIVTDNEQPSTSLAAHKARELCAQKDKADPQVDDDTIFKKPQKPAPRVKSRGKTKELDKLMHSVIYRKTSLDDGSISSEGLRRSKRGQVPIKNTWCHTQDIMDMPFMGAKSLIQKPKNKSTSTLKSVGKKKSTAATKKIINPLSDRGPVCSSTPRNPDVIVEPFPDSAFLGQHSAISSRDPSSETDTHSHNKFGPVILEDQTTSNNGNNRFRNWLLGVSSVQPSETNDQGKAASLVEDMRFTELDGIDYAFYDTKETAALGYMRFKPHQVRNKKKVKACPLKFVVQIGEFAVQYGAIDGEEEESCILREGDMIEIDKGSRYSIQNILDAIGVLLVIRS
ncbi:uncharacterized protein LOC110187698 [Drosophila serrata]|uniref:uncharacterized protein LOC110187698 n=1 Tax=Drosophila serrata TaxID=7274 RepID=UPI000A1CF439|nr:uncharacterized protein LOC110187698 [Drosophila serrata]